MVFLLNKSQKNKNNAIFYMEMIKMWFWWFIFCFNQLTPILMILGGQIMWKHSPKNINSIIGYRTSRSMKNIDTWLFAQKHCGKLWWKIGLFLFHHFLFQFHSMEYAPYFQRKEH